MWRYTDTQVMYAQRKTHTQSINDVIECRGVFVTTEITLELSLAFYETQPHTFNYVTVKCLKHQLSPPYPPTPHPRSQSP